MKKIYYIITILLIAFLASGCTGGRSSDADCLRFGVLRVEDSIPLIVAEHERLFPDTVEIIVFSNTRDMDLALEAGILDGVLSDMVRAMLLKKSEEDIRIVASASEQIPGKRRFAMVSSPGSDVYDWTDINKHDIAISGNSVIAMLAEKMLQEKGISEDQVAFRALPDIRLRMEAVVNDAVPMAVLPEPLVSLAEQEGARVILSDLDLSMPYSQTVFIFRSAFIADHPEKIEDFLKTFTNSSRIVNNNSAKYVQVVREKTGISLDDLSDYLIRSPERLFLPEAELLAAVNEWMIGQNIIDTKYDYSELVTEAFLEQ